MKVVVNRCYGGFSISKLATQKLADMGCESSKQELLEDDRYGFGWEYRENRTDPKLIKVVEELGKLANGEHSELEIVEIPFEDERGWHIEDYDGIETIHEDHRYW